MREFTIKLPMRMKINKYGELESLNLNVYRNLHFYKLNYQKKAFQLFVKPFLSGLPPMEAVSLHYEINPKGGSRLDTMNVGSIVDKFFSDALVENGIIPDDDYKHVVGNSFSFGSLHPENPHVLVTITETQLRKVTPMRILLDQSEIQQALETFVQSMGLTGASGVELSIVGDEIQAEIMMNGLGGWSSINDAITSTDTATDQPPKRRGGRVPGSKNKPKGLTDVAATSKAGNDLDGSGDTEAGEGEDQDQPTEGDDNSEGSAVNLFGEGSGTSDEEDDGTGTEESPSGSSPRGNLFGDSDSESSEATDPDEEGSNTKAEAPPVNRKRPSIFDAD
jgi:hypothetical protein